MDRAPERTSTADSRQAGADALPDRASDTSGDLGADVRDLGPDRVPDLPADLPTDLGRDLRDLASDPLVDLAPDRRRDLGPDGRDLAADLAPDLAPDLRPDSRRDVGVDLRDLAADLGRDLSPDLARDLGADRRDLGADGPGDLAVDRLPDLALEAGSETASRFCTADEPYVLILSGESDGTSRLYRFYPATLSTVRIGTVSCGTAALNSLTASTIGPAYISNANGALCVVDLKTFTAAPTGFDPSTIANQRFGMAVLPDSVPAGQTLYIATKHSGEGDTLSRIDLSTFAVTTIGPVQIDQDAGTPSGAVVELTAGSGGELYGFGIGTTDSLLLTIDPTTGHAIQVSSVPVGASTVSYALVDWQGTIYLFFADGAAAGGATIFTFHQGDAQVIRVGSIDVPIIGAGVARCQ
jgi:hypothetical protein